MSKSLYKYFSPMLFPLFPQPEGALIVELDLQHMLDKCLGVAGADATLTVRAEAFADGAAVSATEKTIGVKGGVAEVGHLLETYSLDVLGYLEISIVLDRPLLRRVYIGDDYALWARAQHGAISFGAEAKYALDRIVQQIKAHRKFCLVHSACLIDRARGLGNTLMLINPYEQQIVARIVSTGGRRKSQKVKPKSVALFDLLPVLDEGVWSTVMVTANNRLPVLDLRHPFGEPTLPYSLDHLDTFSGYATHQNVPFTAFARDKLRRGLRDLGIRYK